MFVCIVNIATLAIFVLFGQRIVDVFEKVKHIQKEVKVYVKSSPPLICVCACHAFVCPGRRSCSMLRGRRGTHGDRLIGAEEGRGRRRKEGNAEDISGS